MPTPPEALVRIEECKKNRSKSLDLSYLGITQIPHEIIDLVWLEELNLSNNQITKIVKIENLENISQLYLSHNQITKLDGLAKLENISQLDLSHNQITKIDGLTKLKNLSIFNLSHNQITKIQGLSKLINISQLNLSHNRITKIQGLSKLINISQLYLSQNLILKIEGFSKLINLSILKIDDNPLEDKYDDLLLDKNRKANHWGIIKNILDREAEGGKNISITLPTKILLLGNHASGKSSLLHYLQNKNLKYSGNSTHLLKIESYPTDKNPNAIFYDFGGQDYYHGIYRAFLSSGSVYLLLWNKDNNENKIEPDSKGLQNQNFKVSYWLGQKKHLETSKYGNEQDPILLIQTHAQENQTPIYISEYQEDGVQNTFYVSLHKKYNPAKNKAALLYLKAEIDALIESKKRTRNEKEWYVKFYEYVLTENKTQAVPVKDLLTHYKPTNKKDDAEKLSSLQAELHQFHNQGIVLYYPDIDDSKVWLNPAGLVEYVHEHILQKKLIGEFEGKVPFEEFNKVDKNIIALLEKQKVLFKHEFGDKGVEYIVPNFLPLVKNNETEYDLFTFGLGNPLFTLKFEQFLPIGLINQLICFFGRQPDKKKFWRDQLLFTFEKICKVLIRLDFELLEIKVLVSFLEITQTQEKEQIGKYLFYCIMAMYWDLRVQNFQSFLDYKSLTKFQFSSIRVPDTYKIEIADEEFFDIISGTSIKQIFDDKEYQPQDLYVSRDDKYFVEYTLLAEHEPNETRIISHTLNSDRTLSTKTVEIPVKPFEIFTNKKMNAMKKVFISYSKDDLSMVHRFRDALIPLHDDGIIESPWYCTFLEAGSLWDAEIQQKLQESDIVFFMCSMSFIRTKYIREHEIKTAIESNKTIIPVILNFCEWDRYLGDYTALPYTSKPVADFSNKDLAWLLVTKGVRWSLETDQTKQEELDKQVRKLYERLVEGKLDDNSK